MSDQCHVCGPVRHEAPTVICAPCALQQRLADVLNESGMRAIVALNCCRSCGGLMLTASTEARCASGCP